MNRRSLLGGLVAALSLGYLPRVRGVVPPSGPCCFVPWLPAIKWEPFFWPSGMEGVPIRMAQLGDLVARVETWPGRYEFVVNQVIRRSADDGGVWRLSARELASGWRPTHDEARLAAERALIA